MGFYFYFNEALVKKIKILLLTFPPYSYCYRQTTEPKQNDRSPRKQQHGRQQRFQQSQRKTP